MTRLVRGNYGNLLRCLIAQQLKLVVLSNQVLSVNTDDTPAISATLNEYKNVFSGIGKLKDFTIKIHVNEDVPPIAQSYRRISLMLKKKLEAKLAELERDGITEDMTGPIPWVSPIIVALKHKNPDDIIVCEEMHTANQAIVHERQLMHTVGEILVDLNGSKYFSKLDLNQGYHQ